MRYYTTSSRARHFRGLTHLTSENYPGQRKHHTSSMERSARVSATAFRPKQQKSTADPTPRPWSYRARGWAPAASACSRNSTARTPSGRRSPAPPPATKGDLWVCTTWLSKYCHHRNREQNNLKGKQTLERES